MGAPRGFARLPETERRMTAQIAAHLRWSRTANPEDRKQAFAGANAALRGKWAREVDPDGRMSPDELEAAVESRRQAHYARMRLASARARRARKEGRTAA